MPPRDDYARRLADLRALEVGLERRRAWAGNVRFAVLLAVPLVIILLATVTSLSPAWLLLPTAAFVALSAAFAAASGRLASARRAAAYYEFGLSRLEDR